jgi:hypothetical protein
VDGAARKDGSEEGRLQAGASPTKSAATSTSNSLQQRVPRSSGNLGSIQCDDSEMVASRLKSTPDVSMAQFP